MALRVLVVEDEFLIAADLTDLIEERGHVVIGTAATLEKALRLVDGNPPDTATVDLRLKRGESGADVAGALLERFGVRSIFVSGNLDKRVRESLAALEPVAFVGKPILPHLLYRALDEAEEQLTGASRRDAGGKGI